MSPREPGSNQNTIKGFLRERKGDRRSNLLSQPRGRWVQRASAMKRDCVRPSAWGAATKGFFCATVFGLSMQVGPVVAQSGQALPPVTIDAPAPQAARPTRPARRASQSQRATRQVAAPAQQQVVEQDVRGGAGRERANG